MDRAWFNREAAILPFGRPNVSDGFKGHGKRALGPRVDDQGNQSLHFRYTPITSLFLLDSEDILVDGNAAHMHQDWGFRF
jgi:hypothetical protein